MIVTSEKRERFVSTLCAFVHAALDLIDDSVAPKTKRQRIPEPSRELSPEEEEQGREAIRRKGFSVVEGGTK
jgi:hypothetical protein